MITARRDSKGIYDVLGKDNGGVAVLEREEAENVFSEVKTSRAEGIDAVKERMKRNLDMILNYDKPVKTAEPVETEDVVSTPVAESRDEDIRPTSTTMQFGDGDVNQMFNELKESHKERQNVTGKTRLVLALYAIAITVILALIIINTGVLSVITSKTAMKQAELETAISEYETVRESLSDLGDEHVIDVAVNELGMID